MGLSLETTIGRKAYCQVPTKAPLNAKEAVEGFKSGHKLIMLELLQILQAIADHHGRPGWVLHAPNSSLYHREQNHTLFPDLRMQYSGSVLLMLLGDPTYPLLWFLVTLAADG